jgi:hypothetical protein
MNCDNKNQFRLGNVAREVLEIRLAEVLSQCDKDSEMGAIISVRDEAFRVMRRWSWGSPAACNDFLFGRSQRC